MALSEDEQRRLDEMETALRRTVVAVVFVLGMVVMVGGLVATAETVLAGVLISTVGLMMMVAVAVALLRWRRYS